MLLRAQTVLPIDGPALTPGAVRMHGERVQDVASQLAAAPDEIVWDLGNAILLPGFVNAHVHLDLATLPAPISAHDGYTAWVTRVIAARSAWNDARAAAAIARDAHTLLASGVTTIADWCHDLRALPHLATIPQRTRVWIEVIANTWERYETRLAEIATILHAAVPTHASDHGTTGVNPADTVPPAPMPHTAHTCIPNVLGDLARRAAAAHNPFTLHAAESPEEMELFNHARGPLAEFLAQFHYPPLQSQHSVVRYLATCNALARNTTLIHANHLCDDDFVALQHHHAQIIHCPLSYQHFGFHAFRARDLHACHIPIALGTDSHGSCASMNFFETLRAARATTNGMDARAIVTMATAHGARALGLAAQLGTLTPGKFADLIAIDYPNMSEDPYDTICAATTIRGALIGGKVAYGFREFA